MATTKKPTKSNKTAHVLNVITAGHETAETIEGTVAAEESGVSVPTPAPTAPAAPAAVPPAAAAPAMPILEVKAAGEDEDLSNQIMGALVEELEEDSETLSSDQPFVPAAPAAPEAPAAPVPDSLAPYQPVHLEDSTSSKSGYVNVMQAMVEDKAEKYIKLLGVCDCSRCVADVKALALSNLTPKYIVVRRNQRFPITAYETRYGAAVTAQLISACHTIMASPRHSDA